MDSAKSSWPRLQAGPMETRCLRRARQLQCLAVEMRARFTTPDGYRDLPFQAPPPAIDKRIVVAADLIAVPQANRRKRHGGARSDHGGGAFCRVGPLPLNRLYRCVLCLCRIFPQSSDWIGGNRDAHSSRPPEICATSARSGRSPSSRESTLSQPQRSRTATPYASRPMRPSALPARGSAHSVLPNVVAVSSAATACLCARRGHSERKRSAQPLRRSHDRA